MAESAAPNSDPVRIRRLSSPREAVIVTPSAAEAIRLPFRAASSVSSSILLWSWSRASDKSWLESTLSVNKANKRRFSVPSQVGGWQPGGMADPGADPGRFLGPLRPRPVY